MVFLSPCCPLSACFQYKCGIIFGVKGEERLENQAMRLGPWDNNVYRSGQSTLMKLRVGIMLAAKLDLDIGEDNFDPFPRSRFAG